MAKRIVIAGGGTGGHIFPAIAIANALQKADPSLELLFIGAKGKMEMEKVPEAGYIIQGIDIAGFNRSSLVKNWQLPFKLVKSFFQVRSIFSAFEPDAVIGVGGYSSFPVLRYAQAKGIPTFIHESNSFAGKANRQLGKRARKIFVASEGMNAFFPETALVLTGNPVRSSIVNSRVSKKEGIEFFGLEQDLPTVFITGGSLGAKGINEAIATHFETIAKQSLQLIWQTGKEFAPKAAALAEWNKQVWTNAFISKMECAYAAADVVVSRAGAMAIAECCVAQKPVVFVPYPFAAEDHQTSNAKYLVDHKAALLVKDAQAKEELVRTLLSLLGNEGQRREMSANLGRLAVRDADTIIANQILDTLK